jgi:hypothetical protein
MDMDNSISKMNKNSMVILSMAKLKGKEHITSNILFNIEKTDKFCLEFGKVINSLNKHDCIFIIIILYYFSLFLFDIIF